jgi:hypothetical protein
VAAQKAVSTDDASLIDTGYLYVLAHMELLGADISEG